jgi:hypothetical protein
MSRKVANRDMTAAIKQIVERYVSAREGTPAHEMKTQMGPKRTLLDKAANEGYLLNLGPKYLPCYPALGFVESNTRDYAERCTTLVFRALRALYEQDGDRMCNHDVALQMCKTIDPTVSPEAVTIGMMFAKDFQMLIQPWNMSDGDNLNLSVSDRLLDFDNLRSAWKRELKRKAEINAPQVVASNSRSNPDRSTPLKFETTSDTYVSEGVEGEGGTARVFRVLDSANLRLALKCLRPEEATTTRTKRFLNELKFCRISTHPNVVKIIDEGFVVQDGKKCPFYVMRLYPSTLRKLLKTGIPAENRMRYFADVLDGVEAAHLQGVWHRDLKPENILHDPVENRLVVSDFGIAHFTAEQMHTMVETKLAERLANFHYAAPEQRSPGRVVDQRADIYALALILNELFTGHVPQGTRFRQIKEVAPDFSYLDELVEWMMRQQPDQRPQSVAEVKNELIGRGNQFVQHQRLEALKKQVVQESELSDPIISDPIRAVEKVDYERGVLTLRLNRPVTPKWEDCFRLRATAFTVNVSSAVMSFSGDKVLIRVNEHFLPQATSFFKQYCEAANEEYATRIKREHQQEIERGRAELRRRVMEQEAKAKALEKVRI